MIGARDTGLLVPSGLPPDAVETIRRAFPEARLLALSTEPPGRSRRLAGRVRRQLGLRGGLPAPALRVDDVPLAAPLAGVHAFLATAEVADAVTRAAVPLLPDLRWIHSTVTGVDRLAGLGLPERGVLVTSPRGIHARRIAEFVVGLVYADAKRIPERWDAVRAGRPRFLGSVELRELVVGVLGFGAIGQQVARLSRANGMGAIAWVIDEATAPRIDGVEVTASLDAVLAAASVLVLALPLTDQTRHLVGAREIARLPPGAVLVNVGRGATLVERDLHAALESGRLRRAWLDVTEGPPDARHPLCRSGRIVYTGHSASESRHTREDLLSDFLRNLEAFRRGEPLPGRIDVERGF